MMRRVLALFVVLSWITLSGVDALEDLDFDSHTTRDFGTAAGWPTSKKPVKLANNILELANANPPSLQNRVPYLSLAHNVQPVCDSVFKPLRSHKEHRVLLI
jgi:hypothetical protein